MNEIIQRRITALEKRISEYEKKQKMLKNKIKKIQIYAENKY